MFLAMNRFKIALGYEEGFEKVWKERDSYLDEVDGFVSFNLMKGAVTEEYVLYASIRCGRARMLLKHGPNRSIFERRMLKPVHPREPI